MPLYHRVVSVDNPGLYFIGFIQPLGPIMPIAEAQAEWIADLLLGKAALPSAPEMRKEIAAYDRWLKKRFVASKRHTIEVDFHPYLRGRSGASASGVPRNRPELGRAEARGAGPAAGAGG